MCRETLYGISAAELADLACVHLATARRWKRTGKCPRSVERLVRVCHRGELDDLHRAWRGWSLVRGLLYSPEGWEFTPGQVRSLPLIERHLKEARRAQGFIAQANWVSGRYETPAGAYRSDECPASSPPIAPYFKK